MYDIGDLLEGDMDGDLDGEDLTGDSLVGDSLLGDMLGDSLVGDSLVGDDGSMGSFLSRIFHKRGGKRALQRAMLAKEVNKAQLLKTIKPAYKRNWALPFGPTSVTQATTQNIQQQPQVVFRGRRLVIPSPIAPNFNFSIVIGIATQQVQFGFLPAIAYVENSVGMNLGLNTAQIGQTITLAAQNTDANNAHTFQALLQGVASIAAPC